MSAKGAAPAKAAAVPTRSGAPARLLQRQCACGTLNHGEDECTGCRKRSESGASSGGGSVQRARSRSVPLVAATPAGRAIGLSFARIAAGSRSVQAKLVIGQADDRYEHEADRVASLVTGPARRAESTLTAYAAAPDVESALRSRSAMDAAVPKITAYQPTASSESDAVAPAAANLRSASQADDDGALERTLERRQSSGAALPPALREAMERRFGADLSAVRLHTDGEAGGLSESIDALAFTYGQHIYFARGAFRPGTSGGDRLLAHELTHTIQQSGGSRGQVARKAIQRNGFSQKPLSGDAVHGELERRLRDTNDNLVTEAPIPGGTTEKVYAGGDDNFGILGQADLYESTPARTIPGIRGSLRKQQRTYVAVPSPRLNEAQTKSGAPAVSPRAGGSGGPAGAFPNDVKVADLKPLAPESFSESTIAIAANIATGHIQVDHYVRGLASFVSQYTADQQLPAQPFSAGRLSTLAIPPELDYRQFDQRDATKGKAFRMANSRYWLYSLPNAGLYVYFTLPADFPLGTYKTAIDKVFAELQKVNKPLTTAHPPVPTALGIAKARRASPKPRGERARPRRAVQRKDDAKVDWSARASEWKQARDTWKKQADAFLKGDEGKAIARRTAFDQALGVGGQVEGAFAPLRKEFKGVRLWASPIGLALGEGRFLLGGAFDKVHAFYDKVRERFHKLHRRMQGVGQSWSGVGWRSKVVKALIKAVKVGFVELLLGLYGIFASCINGVKNAVIAKFTDDIEEEAAERLKGIYKPFEDFERQVKADFEARFGPFEGYIEEIDDLQKWLTAITQVEAAIRLAIQINSCLEPPALGCLWGIGVNLASEVALELGIDLVLDSQTFHDKVVQPAVQDALKKYLGEEIQSVISWALNRAGLTEYGNSVRECNVKVKPEEAVWRYVTKPSGLSDAEMKARKEQWESEHRGELLRQVAARTVKDGHGTPATESDIADVLQRLREKSVNGEEFRRIVDKARAEGGGRINIATVQLELGALRYAAEPPAATVRTPASASGGRKGSSVFEIGPIGGAGPASGRPDVGTGTPAVPGVTIRIPGT